MVLLVKFVNIESYLKILVLKIEKEDYEWDDNDVVM